MCDCTLLVEALTSKPITMASVPHHFLYDGKRLLKDIEMKGIIDYAAAHEIKDSYGVKHGYMLIIGEKA